MNIIEAIKSGKKYRQKGDRGYYHPPDECSRYTFTLEQILADDWEIEPDPVGITRDSFFQAYVEALKETEIEDTYRLGELVNCMAKRLGL